MIAQTIQLALAPVFALVAVGNIMTVLTNRLGRVVDRSRKLQEIHAATEGGEHDAVVREIRIVDRRIALIGRALLMLVLSGLCIGTVVIMLFFEQFGRIALPQVIAAFFITAIVLAMAALVLLLQETRLASSALRIPKTYLELDRRL